MMERRETFLERLRRLLPTDLELLKRVVEANQTCSIEDIKQAVRATRPMSDERIISLCKQELGPEAPDEVDACLEQLRKKSSSPREA